MNGGSVLNLVWAAGAIVLVVVVLISRRRRREDGQRPHRRRRGVGPGAVGAVYDLLNEDKRKAVEIIVEQRAEERRPEYPDGNLPDLEKPTQKPR